MILKREKILFGSPQGMESRPVRSSYKKRRFHSTWGRTNNRADHELEGWGRQEGRVFPLGTASLLAGALQRLWFKHRMGSCSIQLPSSSGILCIFSASAKQALYNIARKKKNYFSPVTAFLTRQFLPNSLSRLCWLGLLNVFNHKPVENISYPGSWKPLEYNFIIIKA